MKELIVNYDDVMNMLDGILKEEARLNWETFYADREKNVPFFVNAPDENLVSYFEKGLLQCGKVLELGCGPGRNAIYFAKHGCSVDAVDGAQEPLKWGVERAKEKGVNVNFIHENIFDLQVREETYDIVYDSGCFHHIAPHRRRDYIELLQKALKPKGFFALTCFTEGGQFGGATISDWDVYRLRSLKGGLGFTDAKLRAIFHEFDVVEIREMKDMQGSHTTFGVSGLWTALFQKK